MAAMMTVDASIARDLRLMTDAALRALARRTFVAGWHGVLVDIRREFRRRRLPLRQVA